MQNMLYIQKSKCFLFIILISLYSCFGPGKMPKSYRTKFTPDTVATNIFDGKWIVKELDTTIKTNCDVIEFNFSGSNISIIANQQEFGFKGLFRINDSNSLNYFYVPIMDDLDQYRYTLSDSFLYLHYNLNVFNRNRGYGSCARPLIHWFYNVRNYSLIADSLTLVSLDKTKIILRRIGSIKEQ